MQLGRIAAADNHGSEYDDDDDKKQLVPVHSLVAMQSSRSFPPKLTDATSR